MRSTPKQEIEAVLKLDAQRRFEHFVKRVADGKEAFALWAGEGWALMGEGAGVEVFPLWPAAEYVELHRTGEWAGFEARAIPLQSLIEELLPSLESRGMRPAVFPTPAGLGVTLAPGQLAAALRDELARWYD